MLCECVCPFGFLEMERKLIFSVFCVFVSQSDGELASVRPGLCVVIRLRECEKFFRVLIFSLRN